MLKKLKPSIGLKSIILIVVCGILILIDLLTKHYEELFDWNFKIIPGLVEVSGNIRNPGCAFSFLNENPEVGQPILITLTFIMLAFLIFVFIFLPERFTITKISVSVVIAGAIGNLVDRLMFREVRDFIGLNMLFDKQHLVFCNIADFCIVIGAILLIIDLLFLNEWAVFPLTKSAKAAQAKRDEEESASEPEEKPQPEWTLVKDEPVETEEATEVKQAQDGTDEE